MDFVERTFGLRKCAPREPDATHHKHCLNDIVRFCSAPCIGRITREAYLEKVAAACAFLRGETPVLLETMRERMAEAAAHHQFEEAAALRDTWFMLKEITHQRARVASTPEIKAEDAKAGITGLQEALGLSAPPQLIECYDISNISGTHSVASMVSAVDGMPSPNRYRHFRIRTVHQADDPAMMAEVIRRRFERLQREGGRGPDLLVVDGGLSQLNAARGELLLLGITHVPVIGLAKRFEEIHVPGQATPLRLPSDSKALYVLQRIRDEAHRFALAYHRRLRGRRLRESVLDEIPGMGEKRKTALLTHFGSVLRLQRASAEEIAVVPGVSLASAKTITEWLRAKSSSGTHQG
jgi:excinuclease ABC subunit C